MPSNLPFILCLESVVDVCVHHACHDTLLPVIKLAVQCVTKQYKAQHTRPDLLQVLDMFCKVNAAAILDAYFYGVRLDVWPTAGFPVPPPSSASLPPSAPPAEPAEAPAAAIRPGG